LAVAALLLRRRKRTIAAQSAPHPHIALPTGIWTPKVIALTAAGCVIVILLFVGASNLFSQQFRPAAWAFAASALLIVAFFRRRRIALALLLIGTPLAWAWPIEIVKPTVAGTWIILADGAALIALIIWLTRKYPNAKRGDLQKFFDRDPE
jgi:hypothetical protein